VVCAIKQYPVLDQLKQTINDSSASPKVCLPVPSNARLPPSTVRFAGMEVAHVGDNDLPMNDPIIEDDPESTQMCLIIMRILLPILQVTHLMDPKLKLNAHSHTMFFKNNW
jgi:hypothetical protein